MSGTDAHKNFAYSTVVTAPSPAASGLSLVVGSGHGARFPAVPFNVTVWPAGDIPTPLNAEILRVTAIATDTLTITRAQEGSSARSIIVGDQIAATITAKTLTDVEAYALRQTFHGLHLRTHPDADVAASKVMLVRADEIVMDDGTRVADWDRLVADIAAAGAGGLDTGAEAASTWYEVYAIRKSSDGTKNLLLHRAKDYFLDTSFTTGTNANRKLRLLTSTATDKLAQGVQFATAGPLSFIDVEISRTGAVSGNVWFSIQASSGGDASGTALATTDKMDASLVSTSAQIVRFIFRSPFTTAAATQYHLVLEGDYAKSDTVFLQWDGVAAGGYASGVAREYNGTVWANASGIGDFYFKANIKRNDAAVTMPTGYDQKCKVGYVYNDSGSNFDPFVAHGNSVRTLERFEVALIAATIPTLTDISAYVPPVPVVSDWWLNIGASAFGAAAGVPDGFREEGGDSGLGGAVVNYHTSGESRHILGQVFTEMQGIYFNVSASTGQYQLYGYRW